MLIRGWTNESNGVSDWIPGSEKVITATTTTIPTAANDDYTSVWRWLLEIIRQGCCQWKHDIDWLLPQRWWQRNTSSIDRVKILCQIVNDTIGQTIVTTAIIGICTVDWGDCPRNCSPWLSKMSPRGRQVNQKVVTCPHHSRHSHDHDRHLYLDKRRELNRGRGMVQLFFPAERRNGRIPQCKRKKVGQTSKDDCDDHVCASCISHRGFSYGHMVCSENGRNLIKKNGPSRRSEMVRKSCGNLFLRWNIRAFKMGWLMRGHTHTRSSSTTLLVPLPTSLGWVFIDHFCG